MFVLFVFSWLAGLFGKISGWILMKCLSEVGLGPS